MSFRVVPLREQSADAYDLLIGAIGYETRSTFVASRISAARRALFPYSGQTSDTFAKSMTAASQLGGLELVDAPTLGDFDQQVVALLQTVNDGARVAIDISSLDRRRLALLIQALDVRGSGLSELTVDILYAPAAYSPPPEHLASSPLEAGPVGDAFHGHLRRTSLPLTAVFGLGYEPQRAIGAFELLEPSRAWAFWPDSHDENYARSLKEANRLLLSIFAEQNVLTYPVLDPGETFFRLESLVSGLRRDSRVVLVPMGPKVFAVCCLLLGLSESIDRPAVWRIGVAGPSAPVDVEARGEIVGLRLEFNGVEPGSGN